jgi:hypothetical protein
LFQIAPLGLEFSSTQTFVAEPAPHHFSGTGAATRCGSGTGSGSDGTGSKPDAQQKWIIKKGINYNSFLIFLR